MSDLTACVWCDEAMSDREVAYVTGIGALCGDCWWKWRDGQTVPARPEPDAPEPARPRCPGHGGPGPHGEYCCHRAGEYSGFGGDGPRRFTCPKDCSCHD